jgi:hydroxyethylthiazole kinase-like uncharacterized protein yjeF
MITLERMAELENNCGIPKIKLMENAGVGAAKIIIEKFSLTTKKVILICHHGNNGGDGFVIGRILSNNGFNVNVLFIGDEKKFKTEAKENFNLLKKIKNVRFIQDYKKISFNSFDIIVDCIYGTGFSGEIKGTVKDIIQLCNQSNAELISIDVPTGIDPKTGKESNIFFAFDILITFHDVKEGLINYADKSIIVDIGIKDDEKY